MVAICCANVSLLVARADSMEFLSELYDGNYQKRYTITHGLQEVPQMYVTLLSATTTHWLKEMDAKFFIQGTGNRFMYTYFPVEKYETPKIDPVEYFSKGWIEKREQRFEMYAERLQGLFKEDQDHYVLRLGEIFVEAEAGKFVERIQGGI